MRITDSILLSDALLNQSRASQQLATLSQESASGNLINTPSDNPTGFSMVTSIDAQLTVLQGRNTVAVAAANNIDVASGALSSAGDLLVQAKQIAIENANGTVDPATRAQAATQVLGLVQQMIQLGNTKGTNGYLFGGTDTTTPPFDAAGNFSGNNNVTQVAVADGVLVTSNVSGADAFTAAGGGTNVIADMQALATALSSNNLSGITAGIDQMDTDREQVMGVMVDAGARSSTLQASATLMSSLTTSTMNARSTIDNAATAQVYSELQATQTAYQTALDVTQQVLSLESFQSRES
jgi:flagellar hook-associated protein 3 FlgL